MEDIDEITESTLNMTLISTAENEDKYNDIPILKCINTIKFITRSKVLIIMKGLPGSGKSTIVKAVKGVYPESCICSADSFFGKGTRYKFDQSQLSEAHKDCKQCSVEACVEGASPILIDNTNVHFWEMRFYIKLADAFNYLVVVLEPNTPWSKDPGILATKNSHGVEIAVLKKKVKNYESVSPLYLGWFLNEPDSVALSQRTKEWLQKASDVPQFMADLTKRVGLSLTDVIQHFSKGSYALDKVRLLHCTSRYTAKDDQVSLDHYMESSSIKEELGRASTLTIVGFVITPNTLGARVDLTPNQLKVWGGGDDDDTGFESDSKSKRKRFHGPPVKPQDIVEIPGYSPQIQDLLKMSTLREDGPLSWSEEGQGVFVRKGRRAHITMGTASMVPPKTTGLELMQLMKRRDMTECGDSRVYPITGGTLRDWGMGYWEIVPAHAILVEALFTYQL